MPVAIRHIKAGYPIYRQWYQYERYDEDGKGSGKRSAWVETDCSSCSSGIITMPLSKLVRDGSEQCDGCRAYSGRYR